MAPSTGQAAALIGGDLAIGTLLLWLGNAWHTPWPAIVVYLGGVFMVAYLLLAAPRRDQQ